MNKKISQTMSYLLRHNPDGLKMSKDGWVKIYDLSEKIGQSREKILEIVKTDDKNRYSVSVDGEMIMANQGHSIDVKIDFKEAFPPPILYHGTSKKNCDLIIKNGIKKMNRQFVHLSSDKDVAYNVGSRHSKNDQAVVLSINTNEMVKDKIKFFKSKNGVWLVDFVDPKYLTI